MGLLQAVLTAVGATNGGLTALIVNEPILAFVGLGLVLMAMAILGLLTAFDGPEGAQPGEAQPSSVPRKIVIVIGVLATIGGLGVTGYAALAAPALAGEPDIVASVTSGSPLVLQAKVKASAVDRREVFHVEVDGVGENKANHSYILSIPVLYQSQLGSDSSGNVDTSLMLPIPSGRYEDIAISAWSGSHPGPCGSLMQTRSTIPSGNATSRSRKGCAVVRIAGLTPARSTVRDAP